MIGGLLQPVPAVLGVTGVMLRAGLLDDLYASYAWESQSGFVECFKKKTIKSYLPFSFLPIIVGAAGCLY